MQADERASNRNTGNLKPAGDFSIGSNVWPGVSKIIEESGELNQVLGKLIATNGDTEHWDGSDLRGRMIEELGDVMAAIEFLVKVNKLDRGSVIERASGKLRLFEYWHDQQRT